MDPQRLRVLYMSLPLSLDAQNFSEFPARKFPEYFICNLIRGASLSHCLLCEPSPQFLDWVEHDAVEANDWKPRRDLAQFSLADAECHCQLFWTKGEPVREIELRRRGSLWGR